MRALTKSQFRRPALLLGVLVLAGCGNAAADPAGTGNAPRPIGTLTATQGVLPGGPVLYGPGTTATSLTPIGRRDAGPVALRSFRGPGIGSGGCDPYTQSCVPEWCQPSGTLVTELSTDAIAVSRRVGIIGLAPGSPLSVLAGPGAGPYDPLTAGQTVGSAEGAPVQVQSVRVAPEVTTVKMTTPDGEDSVAPSDGLATVAVQGKSDTGRLVALDGAGRELASVDLPARGPYETPACAPQPPRPPDAGTPPADPAAAEKEIRQAFSVAFTHAPSSDRYRALPAVQGGDRLKPALDQLRQNFPQVADTVTVTTGNLVFTSPTTAAVQFTLNYTGGAPYDTKYGKALLVDGHWLVSRDAFCGALSYASVTCPS